MYMPVDLMAGTAIRVDVADVPGYASVADIGLHDDCVVAATAILHFVNM